MSDIAERIAAEFHRSYENQAPHFGYETRKDSAVPWTEVPQQNRDLMVSVVHALIAQGVIRPGEVFDDNGFVCNRLGGDHRLGTTTCPACRPSMITNHAFKRDTDGRCAFSWGSGASRERCGNDESRHA